MSEVPLRPENDMSTSQVSGSVLFNLWVARSGEKGGCLRDHNGWLEPALKVVEKDPIGTGGPCLRSGVGAPRAAQGSSSTVDRFDGNAGPQPALEGFSWQE